jgi:hypothetical protein
VADNFVFQNRHCLSINVMHKRNRKFRLTN